MSSPHYATLPPAFARLLPKCDCMIHCSLTWLSSSTYYIYLSNLSTLFAKLSLDIARRCGVHVRTLECDAKPRELPFPKRMESAFSETLATTNPTSCSLHVEIS